MDEHLAAVSERIAAIDWRGSTGHTRYRISLMREFLRRSALWAAAVGSTDWPFFDVAARVDPVVRSPEELTEKALSGVPLHPPTIRSTCMWALNFAALRDAKGDAVVAAAPDPFAPLLLMYETGGGFLLDGTGTITIDEAAIGYGSRTEWLIEPPAPAGGSPWVR